MVIALALCACIRRFPTQTLNVVKCLTIIYAILKCEAYKLYRNAKKFEQTFLFDDFVMA